MIRHSASVRFVAGMLAVAGAMALALVLSSVMEDQRCLDTGGDYDPVSQRCLY